MEIFYLEDRIMFPELGYWVATKDGDPLARQLFDRHYSRRHYQDGRTKNQNLFCGPGEKSVLVLPDYSALFVWRRMNRPDLAGQIGVNCAIFRNESTIKGSFLIREACELAWQRWPGQRLYTYVNPKKVIEKRDPGFVFLAARWKHCGTTKGGFLLFEKRVK